MRQDARVRVLLALAVGVLAASCAPTSSVVPSRPGSTLPVGSAASAPSSATSSPAHSPIATASAQATAAAAAIDGLIVFSRHDPGTDDTYCFTIDANGANEAQGHAGACGPPSPDGSRILTTVYQPNGFGPLLDGRPATTNPDGSDFKQLDSYPDDTFNVTCGYWSPDGLRFLCESGEDAKPADDGIYTMRSSDGGNRVRVTRAPVGHQDQPQGYSPDGSQILFERVSDTEPSAEYVVNTDGTGLVRLSPASLWVIDFARTADWSPDGKQVVFASAVESDGHPGLYVVNADGTGLHQIASPEVGGPTAQWSPDDQWIASSTCLRCQPQLFVMHPDGTGKVALTDGADNSTSLRPIWSPDGSRLLYQTQGSDGRVSIWTMKPDGSDRALVADVGTDLSSYSWGTAKTP